MKDHIKPLLLVALLSFVLVACGQAGFDTPGSNTLELPSEALSKIEVNPENVADGITPAAVKISVMNGKGQPLAGVEMGLWVSGTENVIVPCGVSDSNGLTSCKIYSTKAERKTVRASSSNAKVILAAVTDFREPKISRSQFQFVAAASIENNTMDNGMITTAGITESGAAQRDAGGKIRVHSSIQGSVIND